VLFLKTMLIMDFDDFFIIPFFLASFQPFPQTPAAHLWILRVTLVENCCYRGLSKASKLLV
jgi:hypothetical protein